MKTIPRFENASWENDVPQNTKDLVMTMKDSRKGLFLYGTVGSGKSHMCYAIGKYVESSMDIKVQFWNVPELLKEMKDDFGRQNIDKTWTFEKTLEFKGLLVLDDIGAEKMSEWVEETFYILINKRYEQMLPTIFTSNHSIEKLSDRVKDRITSRIVEMCDIVELSGKDRRIK